MRYTVLSEFYDELIGVDYDQWACHIEQMVMEHGRVPLRILDLACGTGEMTSRLAGLGWDATGVDISLDMLAIAEEKLRSQGRQARFLHQDMRFLSCPTKYDLIVCCCDSLNYLLSARQLERSFRRISSCLNPDGLFIFDLNTEYKLAQIYGNNSFGTNTPEYSYIMECTYQQICHIELTFFLPRGEAYVKVVEDHYQRAYTVDQTLDLLKKHGLQPLAQYDNYTFNPVVENTQRIVYVNRLEE